MPSIIAISGSLRKQSFNTALLNEAKRLQPSGCDIELVSINEIPLYNGDDEDAHGIPASVELVKNKLAKADGLLISTPEYNSSIPGVLKNAIDWMSRPTSDQAQVFHNKKVAVVGATPGGLGTVSAQLAWLQVLRNLNVDVWFEKKLYVSSAHNVFNDEMQLIDENVIENLQQYLQGFVDYIQR